MRKLCLPTPSTTEHSRQALQTQEDLLNSPYTFKIVLACHKGSFKSMICANLADTHALKATMNENQQVTLSPCKVRYVPSQYCVQLFRPGRNLDDPPPQMAQFHCSHESGNRWLLPRRFWSVQVHFPYRTTRSRNSPSDRAVTGLLIPGISESPP